MCVKLDKNLLFKIITKTSRWSIKTLSHDSGQSALIPQSDLLPMFGVNSGKTFAKAHF